MVKYYLMAFSQALPDSPIMVNVQAVSDKPKYSSSIDCPPIEGLPPDFTNEDLLKAVSEATGLEVELPTQ